MSVQEKSHVILTLSGFLDAEYTPWNKKFNQSLQNYADEVISLDNRSILGDHRSPGAASENLMKETYRSLRELYEKGYRLEDIEVTAVGHSKGGNSIRYTVENGFSEINSWNNVPGIESPENELTGCIDNEIPYDNIVTIATPHRGTVFAALAYPVSKMFELCHHEEGYFEAPQSLMPGSEYIQKQNNNGIRSDVNYLNIVGSEDIFIPNKKNALIHSAESNVENVIINNNMAYNSLEMTKKLSRVFNQMAKDMVRDSFDMFEKITDLTRGETENLFETPRTLKPARLSLRGAQLKYALEEMNQGTGHIGVLDHEQTMENISEFLQG